MSKSEEQTSCLVGDQNSNDSNGITTPSGGKKSGCVQFERFYVSSLQTSFERVVNNGFCRGHQDIRRDHVCPFINNGKFTKVKEVTSINVNGPMADHELERSVQWQEYSVLEYSVVHSWVAIFSRGSAGDGGLSLFVILR